MSSGLAALELAALELAGLIYILSFVSQCGHKFFPQFFFSELATEFPGILLSVPVLKVVYVN